MKLEEQITQYCEQKQEESILKKSIETLNKSIKEALSNSTKEIKSGKQGVRAGKYEVKLQIKQNTNVDEGKMLEIIKRFWHSTHGSQQCPFIRTVEVIDSDALEGAIYREELPKEVAVELGKCIKRSEIKALVYKEIKEEE